MSEQRKRKERPVFECVGLSGGSIVGGCVIGGRNIRIKGPLAQSTRVVGVQGGHHYNANIIGLDGATIGGSSSDEDEVNLKDPSTYFGGKDTGVLLISGKTKPKDGEVFLNDLDDITEKLKELGIKNDNIFKVTPHGQGNQVRNIDRAVEDLTDLNIKKFIFFYAGHCNKKHEFWIDNRKEDGYWYPHKDLKSCLQKLPATKMLLILDTCYSGALDMGARGEEDGGGNGGTRGDEEQANFDREDGSRADQDRRGPGEEFYTPGQRYEEDDTELKKMDEDDTRAVAVVERELLPYHEPLVPCLWDIFEGREKGDGSTRGGDDTQAVQWCSSSPEELSHNHGGGRNGVFTNAILRYLEDLAVGYSATILDMHKHVKLNISLRQNAVLKPDQAAKPSTGYLKTFPKFRKSRFTQH